ncbi:MAG: 50S ribosomal protein L32 [Kiritimatiellae bacterium]|nr:50S ribosomal protein L32 [Kiritimatiellia bacterium]MCO5045189.1 50S ribosomal protein L32 [Kiritimatiellia bacterium]MCO5062019.1 50S ribosomal protein L32 [Kiritimatiellia bacterium]MCO5069290.1 50S ribosomal protein L32 [Kiritimatiellia bacterium]MCO6400254.1 50S ribosomal protein L32 [Verrucomicrobiota bacterium]
MAVPKRKTSKKKRRQRQASHKKPMAGSARDPKTGSWHQPHRVDPVTGMYGGRQVIIVSTDE